MKSSYIIIILILVAIIGYFSVSVDYPSAPDGYLQLRLAESIYNTGEMPHMDYKSFAPYGRPMSVLPGYQYIIAFFGIIINDVFMAWKITPLIFLFFSSLMLYKFGEELKLKYDYMIPIIFILSFPILLKTIVRDTDIFLLFLFISLIFSIYRLIKNIDNKKGFVFSLIIVLILIIFSLSWYAFVMMFLPLLVLPLLFIKQKKNLFKSVGLITISILSITLVWCVVFPFFIEACFEYEYFCPVANMISDAGGIGHEFYVYVSSNTPLREYCPEGWTSLTHKTTENVSDMQFSTPYKFLVYMNIVPFLFLTGLYFYWKVEKNRKLKMFMILSSIIFLLFAVRYFRMLIFFVPLALLLSFYTLEYILKKQKIWGVLMCFLVILASLCLFYNSYSGLYLDDNYTDAMNWINHNAKDKTIHLYWPDGHFISYAGGNVTEDGTLFYRRGEDYKVFSSEPSQEPLIELHEFWLLDEINSLKIAKKYKMDYIFVHKKYYNYVDSLESYSELKLPKCDGSFFEGKELKFNKNSILYEFIFDSESLHFYELVFQNEYVRVFRVSTNI